MVKARLDQEYFLYLLQARAEAAVNVLLGVTGGIAAFKAVDLVRLLIGRGHQVRCALTRAATSFVSPLTLEILTGKKVLRQEYLSASAPSEAGSEVVQGGQHDREEEVHIAVAAWADVFCVAPGTAHSISRLALGIADDFLTTTALAFSGPMVIAPAMHSIMWSQPVVQENVSKLERRGVLFVGPVDGPLASGESGLGRMAEPMTILSALESTQTDDSLAGKRVLISAGPTRESIDPVRYISNRSSGRMGFSLAREAARRGAQTALVAGPVALQTPAGVERVDVISAEEMQTQMMNRAATADVIIMTAAVADFRPMRPAEKKLKKRDGVPSIVLEPNPDILAGLAGCAPNALRIGFAAETDDLEANAAEKLNSKGAHLIVANDVSRTDIGFDADDNEVVILSVAGPPERLGRESKTGIAIKLWDIFLRELTSRADKALAITR